VTPAVVCVTDKTFFAALMSFIAAENIAGAGPAILCFSKPNFSQRNRNQSMIRIVQGDRQMTDARIIAAAGTLKTAATAARIRKGRWPMTFASQYPGMSQQPHAYRKYRSPLMPR
jgi:hypothetical protein